MATLTAEPIAFICTSCYNTNCTTTLDTDRNIPCRVCGAELTPPAPSAENIRQGYAFIEQFAAQSDMETAAPTPATAVEVGSPVAVESIAAAEDTNTAQAPESPEKPLVYQATQKREFAKPGPDVLVCSVLKRLYAHLVDAFVLIFLAGISFALFFAMVSPQSKEIPVAALTVLFALPSLFYVVNWVMTAMDGRTIGKYALGIKVVNSEGNPPGFIHGVVLRSWVTVALQALPFFGLIDSCAIFMNDTNRCLHDFIAGTFVIDAD